MLASIESTYMSASSKIELKNSACSSVGTATVKLPLLRRRLVRLRLVVLVLA